MAGGEDHVVFRDPLEAPACRLDQAARFVHGRQWWRRDPFGCQLALNLRPKGQLGAATVESSRRLVLCVDRRHPDDFAPGPSGQLDRDRVQAAHTVVQRQRPKQPAAGHGLAGDLGPLAGLNVVGFDDKPLHAARQELLGAIDVVDASGDDVGSDMDLQVVRALERFPCSVRRGDGSRGRGL